MPAHPAVLTSKPEWQTLKEQRERLDGLLMKDLFEQDPGRAKRYFIEGAGLSLDFSKNRITDEVLEALLALARSCNLEARRDALLRGERVNVTEDRPALHTALRNPGTETITVDGEDVVAEVQSTLTRMETLVNDVLDQRRTGYTGKPFTDVVSIGIGGSYLGPNW